MGERLHTNGIGLERKVYDLAKKAGFSVTRNAPSIRSQTPVPDKHGQLRKCVTHPDLYVENSDGRTMFVEVTTGDGENAHKLAQQRVVDAAGVTNYVQITGDEIEQIEHYNSPQDIREAFCIIFEWFEE